MDTYTFKYHFKRERNGEYDKLCMLGKWSGKIKRDVKLVLGNYVCKCHF